MSKSTSRKKRAPERVLALPDLEHAKMTTATLACCLLAVSESAAQSGSPRYV
jgi:hypothetical protein